MASLETILKAIHQGQMVILVDDEDRENEGDLVLAAEKVTPEAISFMAKHARGLICLSMTEERVDQLALPMMAPINQSKRNTAFTVSIEAREGVSTGISAFDRALTIRTAIDPQKGAADLLSPGHIFPLKARPGGVLERPGHTEGSVDLAKMAGLYPAAVICEIMNDDGTMARRSDLEEFSKIHSIPIYSIRELIQERMQRESCVEWLGQAKLPLDMATIPSTPTSLAVEEAAMAHVFRSKLDGTEHLVWVFGDPTHALQAPLVRIHSECLTGDVLGSLRCDCGQQLQASLQAIRHQGCGILIYLRNQEGRGIGLGNKIKAYALQEQGMDTVEANHQLGFASDQRTYWVAAPILKHFGLQAIRLLTNNPDKVQHLEDLGITVAERVPVLIEANRHNEQYLHTKRDRMGHWFPQQH